MHDRSVSQTFVFADLAGYTALTEAHGDELAADTAAEFSSAASDLLASAGGEEIKRLGDGLMLRVPDAARAVRLGAGLVTNAVAHRSLGIRVGMHTGAAVRRGADWFGSTVNIAARVAALAGAGEVLLTHATRAAADAGLHGVVLDSRGNQRLRHVAEPIELWAVRLEDPLLLIDPVGLRSVGPAMERRLGSARIPRTTRTDTGWRVGAVDLVRVVRPLHDPRHW